MGRVKDLYFAEFEKRYNENIDRGLKDDLAYSRAGDEAYDGVRDALEEKADRIRQQQKDDALTEKIDKRK